MRMRGGFRFSESYCQDRWLRAGSRLCGPYTFALDGIQGDADFVCSLVSTKPTLRLELKYILWFVVPQNDVLKFLGFPLVVQLVFGEFHGKQVPIDTGNVAIYVWPLQAMILKVKINLVCCTHSGGEIPSTAQSSMATLHPIAQDHQT